MRLNKKDIIDFLRQVKPEFEQEFQVSKLGLFGSFALEAAHEESDIDILIEFQAHTEGIFEKKAAIRSILQEKFHREIDLCREKYIKPYFREVILKTATYV